MLVHSLPMKSRKKLAHDVMCTPAKQMLKAQAARHKIAALKAGFKQLSNINF